MDTLRSMALFQEIAERGSLTAAAQSLGTSLPTVVRGLAALERQLGVTLIRRTTRKMSLTHEGELYLQRSRQILADVEEAQQLVSGQGFAHGHLRVGAPVQFGQLHLSPMTVEFLKKHPQVSAELILLDEIVDLVERRIDVAVRIGHLKDSTLRAKRIGQMRLVVVASPAFLKREGTPKHPDALRAMSCVRLENATTRNWRFRDKRKKISIPPRGPFVVNQVAAAIDACVRGIGVGCFLEYQVKEALKKKKLKVILSSYEEPPLPVSLVYPAEKKTQRVERYVQWMEKALAPVVGGRETPTS